MDRKCRSGELADAAVGGLEIRPLSELPRRAICGAESPELFSMQTSFEELAVLFAVLIFFRVERNWSLVARHVVVGPLSSSQMKERVSKEIFFTVAAGGAPEMVKGGRAVPWKCEIYDCTKGFKGEDVLHTI